MFEYGLGRVYCIASGCVAIPAPDGFSFTPINIVFLQHINEFVCHSFSFSSVDVVVLLVNGSFRSYTSHHCGFFADVTSLASSTGTVFSIPSSLMVTVLGGTSIILNRLSLGVSVCCTIQLPVAL